MKANVQNNTHGDQEKTLASPKELRDTCSLSESAFPIEIQNLRNVDRCKSSLNETPFSGMPKSSHSKYFEPHIKVEAVKNAHALLAKPSQAAAPSGNVYSVDHFLSQKKVQKHRHMQQ